MESILGNKEEIAFAQSYFAVQTRKQELIEERISLIERTQARGRLRESEKIADHLHIFFLHLPLR